MSDETSDRFVFWTGVTIALLLSAGIINYLVEGIHIPASVPMVRSIRYQTLVETIAYVVILGLGVAAVEFMRRSVSRIRVSVGYYITGLILLVLFVALTFAIWMAKTGFL